MVRCPGCGENNEPGFRFCRNCGKEIVADDTGPIIAVVRPPTPEPSATKPVPIPPPPPASFKLVAKEGLLAGRTFTLTTKGLLIGRDPSNCQVVIADDEVSRVHAWVGLNDQGQILVRDRNSANGVFVNQVRVQERVLRPTDEFSVGTVNRQVFRVEGAAPKPATPPPAGRPARPEAPPLPSGTSVISTSEISAAQQEEKGKGGTVAIKLTEMMARPHVELIVDRFSLKTL